MEENNRFIKEDSSRWVNSHIISIRQVENTKTLWDMVLRSLLYATAPFRGTIEDKLGQAHCNSSITELEVPAYYVMQPGVMQNVLKIPPNSNKFRWFIANDLAIAACYLGKRDFITNVSSSDIVLRRFESNFRERYMISAVPLHPYLAASHKDLSSYSPYNNYPDKEVLCAPAPGQPKANNTDNTDNTDKTDEEEVKLNPSLFNFLKIQLKQND